MKAKEITAEDLLDLIRYASQHPRFRGLVSLHEVRPPYVTDVRRGNAEKTGRISIAVHDDYVKSVKGPLDSADWRLFLVALPAKAIEQRETKIVLPGEG